MPGAGGAGCQRIAEGPDETSQFGTFPGADGIPKHVCVPDPRHHDCKMNGFIKEAEVKLCKPKPAPCHTDVMGYHVESDIPNYWAFAKNFVLQDHRFEAAGSWSLPDHLYESPAGRPPAPRPATR